MSEVKTNQGPEEVRGGYYSIGVFDGEERFVRFDLNAFAEMERIFGSMEAANEALSKGSMRDVRTVLWLGLIHDHAILDEMTGEPIKYNITQYEIGKWLTPQNMKEVMDKLSAAIQGSVPQDGETGAAGEDGKTPAQALAEAKAKEEAGEEAKVTPFPAGVPQE